MTGPRRLFAALTLLCWAAGTEAFSTRAALGAGRPLRRVVSMSAGEASRREVLGCLPAALVAAAGLPGVAGAESLSPMDGEYSVSTGGFRKITVVPMGFTVGYYMALITSKAKEDASFGSENYVKIRDPNGGANPALSRTLLQTKLFPGDNEGTYSDGTITFKDGSKWSKLGQ